MYETKEQFGKCPVCGAITSLDSEKNQLCDRCDSEIYKQNLNNKKPTEAEYKAARALRKFYSSGEKQCRR